MKLQPGVTKQKPPWLHHTLTWSTLRNTIILTLTTYNTHICPRRAGGQIYMAGQPPPYSNLDQTCILYFEMIESVFCIFVWLWVCFVFSCISRHIWHCDGPWDIASTFPSSCFHFHAAPTWTNKSRHPIAVKFFVLNSETKEKKLEAESNSRNLKQQN